MICGTWLAGDSFESVTLRSGGRSYLVDTSGLSVVGFGRFRLESAVENGVGDEGRGRGRVGSTRRGVVGGGVVGGGRVVVVVEVVVDVDVTGRSSAVEVKAGCEHRK